MTATDPTNAVNERAGEQLRSDKMTSEQQPNDGNGVAKKPRRNQENISSAENL
jgi:hypothetical protein